MTDEQLQKARELKSDQKAKLECIQRAKEYVEALNIGNDDGRGWWVKHLPEFAGAMYTIGVALVKMTEEDLKSRYDKEFSEI